MILEELNNICDKLLNQKNDIFRNARLKYIKGVLLDKNKLLNLSLEEIYAVFRDLGLDSNTYKDLYLNIIKN